MAKTNAPKKGCVAGFVKSRPNRDKTTTFTVAGKQGKRFTLSDASPEAKQLQGATRVLVCYEEGSKNPKVTLVFREPSSRLIRQYNNA